MAKYRCGNLAATGLPFLKNTTRS